jgi:hypothetical protein
MVGAPSYDMVHLSIIMILIIVVATSLCSYLHVASKRGPIRPLTMSKMCPKEN